MSQSDFLHSPQAQQILKNKEKVMGMINSPDAQRLMRLLQQTGGDQLQTAAQAAMKGNPQQLTQIMNRIMATPEGAQAVERINKNLPK